ncbi:MAG: YkgJ family cysteine cluster protein [Agathobacter sp.]|nr:YkgJ family cysteine cluster protein [Agathobacter sp.]
MDKDLLEISDGKLYGNNDMAKVSCHDCAGCSSCCRDMGESIWLDPYDIFQLTRNLGKTMEELLAKEVEFHVEDGLILPNIKMAEVEPKCSFLNEEGRCSIHAFRPGLCRLFPLGRNFEDGKLTYFVLKEACPAPNKSKVKISKWLGVPNLKSYEKFLVEWHGLTKRLRSYYAEHAEEEAVLKAINMKFLQLFYLTAYSEDDFYQEFDKRTKEMELFLCSLGVCQ